jgi:predicted phage terminase large subunit-like protein
MADRCQIAVPLLIMQRCHADDLVGSVLDLDDWTVLDLPAIARDEQKIQTSRDEWHLRAVGDILHPGRESLETLNAIRKTIGSFSFEAQYQQSPVPADGNMIKRQWFRRYDPSKLRDDYFDLVVQSWDTALKGQPENDYSVCTTWGVGKDKLYLLDLYREKLGFPDLLRAARSQASRYSPHTILIEGTGSGTSLLQTLRRESRLPVLSIPQPKYDKETRVSHVSATIEDGRVFLPHDASWLSAFEHEVLAFPNGRHDDQVDSLSQFLRWYCHQRPSPVELKVTLI